MTYNEIISQVSIDTGLPKDFINKVYKSYWRSVREHIVSLPLKRDLSNEEFNALQPNVNIPSIGKLYVTLDRYKRIKKANQIIERNKKDKENAVKDKKN